MRTLQTLLATVMMSCLMTGVSFSQISGPISGTLEDTVIVIGDTWVESGDSLIIMPSTVFLFNGNYLFTIHGYIYAGGTEDDSVVFKANSGVAFWKGIRFEDISSDSSKFEYCLITNVGSSEPPIRINYANPTIDHCSIRGNDRTGIYCFHSNATISNCLIQDNHSPENGGGIQCNQWSNATITNCLIIYNTTAWGGGGIYCWNSSNASIVNCTIAYNSASYGGGVGCGNNSFPTGKNNIIFFNSDQISGSFTFTYSDIQGGYSGVGNINSDPLFVDSFYLSQPTPLSPCVDAGDPSSPMIIGTTSTSGMQDTGIVDMGYHYSLPAVGPSLAIELTPYNPPIIIPEGGGSFAFDVTVTNNSSSTQSFDAWSTIELPTGFEFNALGPYSLTFAPGFSITRMRAQAVPANAPAGQYTYWAYVGTYPWTVVDSDSFTFTKEGTVGDGVWMGPEGWVNTGEPFPGEVVAENQALPEDFALLSASPNPFNPTTKLTFSLPAAAGAELSIYDIQGHVVATLVDGFRDAGVYEVTFEAAGLSSGVYLSKLEAGGRSAAQKLVLLK